MTEEQLVLVDLPCCSLGSVDGIVYSSLLIFLTGGSSSYTTSSFVVSCLSSLMGRFVLYRSHIYPMNLLYFDLWIDFLCLELSMCWIRDELPLDSPRSFIYKHYSIGFYCCVLVHTELGQFYNFWLLFNTIFNLSDMIH